MHLPVPVLSLPFMCPSPVTPLMASICQLPSPLMLWSVGWGWLGHCHRESWAVCWCSVSNKCPISFSIIRCASSISLADVTQGFKVNLAGRHSTLRQKQVRTLNACPAWKWLLQIISLSLSLSSFLTWCKSKRLNSASNHPRSGASGLGDLESRNLEDTHNCYYHSLQINETGTPLFWQQEYKKARHFERAIWEFVSKVLRVFTRFDSTEFILKK